MQKLFSTLFVLAFFSVSAQQSTYTHLSDKFSFKVNLIRFTENTNADSCRIVIDIVSKSNSKKTQSIDFISGRMFFSVLQNGEEYTRSYSTGFNKDMLVRDNDFGNFIVADFNFDTLEDFAIVTDTGGNGGPLYRFYTQDKSGHFVLDSFLTNDMKFFPLEIDIYHKTLTTLVHANAYQQSETIYKLDIVTGKWKEIKSKLVSY